MAGKIRFYLIIFFLTGGTLIGKSQNIVDKEYKKEGLEFSMKVVEAYFKRDCQKAYSYFNEQTATLDGDGVFDIKNLREKICKSVNNAVYDDKKTFVNYKADYRPEILTKSEYQFQYNITGFDYYTPEDDDLLFVGTKRKINGENYIWGDMFVFMIKKINGKWKIIAVSG